MSTTRDEEDVLFRFLLRRVFKYFHSYFKRSKNRKRLPHIIDSSFENTTTLSSPKRNPETLCRLHPLKNHQRKMSSSSSSSQNTGSSSPRRAEVRANNETMQGEALRITPLRAMATDPEKVKKLRSRSVRRTQASPSGKTSLPSSSAPSELVNREGSRSVHEAIARIVTSILNENQSVPGISVRLNQKSASLSLAVNPDVDENVETSRDDADSPVKNDENPSAQASEGHNEIESPVAGEKSPAENISDSILEESPVKNSNQNIDSHIINLEEEFSDNDLIAKAIPCIAKKIMNKKRKLSALPKSVQEKSTKVACKTPRTEDKSLEKSGKDVISKGKSKVGHDEDSPKAMRTSMVKKRKAPELSDHDDDSDFYVTENVTDIYSRKRPSHGKLPIVPDVAIDNISFHHPDNANRWKYVNFKKIALERELSKEALECKDVIDLINEAGLMRTVMKFSNCYEGLVKEFIVNLSNDCADGRSTDFETVFVRGRKVKFSPRIINRYLGRTEEARPELEETDNQVCQTITAKQVKRRPLKEKLAASKLSVKFAILHKIGAANWVPTNHKSTISIGLGRFIYAVGTKAKVDYGSYIFQQTLKHAESYAIKG